MEIVNAMFENLFSQFWVIIKTINSTNILKEALNDIVIVRPLPIGTTISEKVEKDWAHFFGITIKEQQAEQLQREFLS